MQISSLGSYGLYSKLTSSSSASSKVDFQQLLQDFEKQKNASSSTDGDSVTLSTYFSDLQDFWDKVKNGTVTETDLQDMQEKMNSVQSEYTDMPMPPRPPMPPMMGEDFGMMQPGINSEENSQIESISDTTTLDLQSFMEKVKNGTVTDTDLEEMQEIMNSVQSEYADMPMPPRPPMPPMPPMMGESSMQTTSSDLDSSAESLESTTETNHWLNLLMEMAFQAYSNNHETNQSGTLQDTTA